MIELKSFKRRFFWFYSFFSFHVQNGFFFLSLGCFILQLMLIFSLFSFFVFSFNICLIHKEKHAFFHFFHSVFCIFSGLLFIFLSFGFGISWLKERADFFLYNLSTYGWVFFVLLFFFFYIDFFSFLHMFAFLWFKMNWIVHLIWASGSFFSHQHNFCKWPRKKKERHSRGCTAKIRLCVA